MLAAPSEISICGVYMPPLLLSGVLGLLAATGIARQLTKRRLSRHFAAPPLVFVALVILCAGLIETFLIAG
ncbi:DUF1656 domain-containing protein [Solidesulfovibrio alcoholivorans]|uniref:DUF1656 domain-containing protein n=1 Tax=Solidesulfovibrio alcoholivorans TaxID=81406 RepID=UPI00049738ED|nr:DUF1656 domain-containing protein [Solidesulfovibrio alcoholivorans]